MKCASQKGQHVFFSLSLIYYNRFVFSLLSVIVIFVIIIVIIKINNNKIIFLFISSPFCEH